jgi:hypothetical protein
MEFKNEKIVQQVMAEKIDSFMRENFPECGESLGLRLESNPDSVSADFETLRELIEALTDFRFAYLGAEVER